MGFLIPALILSTGLLLVASLLIKPPKGRNGSGDDEPTARATRGDWIPVYYGTRVSERTIVGWAGNRITRKIKAKSGPFGGSRTVGQEYFEEVWHILGVGPATGLLAIRSGGKTIWEGPLTPYDAPSGTTVTTTIGSFDIYWGEKNQPINNFLASSKRLGIRSRWPLLCYVVWHPLKYGQSPQMPQVEYVMEWGCAGTTLSDSPFSLDDGESSGVNSAHVLFELLTGGNFRGAKIDPAEVDSTSLEAAGELFESEHLPANFAVIDGPEVERPVQAILQDMGLSFPQVGTRLAVIPRRYSAADLPVLTDEEVSEPDIEHETDHSESPATRPVFTIKSEEQYAYRDQDVPFNDDGEASQIGLSTSERIEIPTITNIAVASKVARRLDQSGTVRSDTTLKAMRGARLLTPGQSFIREGFGQLFVMDAKPSLSSPEVELSCSLDTYAVPDVTDVLTLPPVGGGAKDPAADIAVTFMEIPTGFSESGEIEFAVFRVRAHQQIVRADIWVSTNGTAYSDVGEQDIAAAGGVLFEEMLSTPDELVNAGPVFEADNFDTEDLIDLAGDTSGWQSGDLIALIEGTNGSFEVFYIEGVDVVSDAAWSPLTAYSVGQYVRPAGTPVGLRFRCTTAGTSGSDEPDWAEDKGEEVADNTVVWEARHFAYRPRKMIRARMGTTAQGHLSGSSRIYIIENAALERYTNPGLVANQTFCVKALPGTSKSAIGLDFITAVCKVIQATEDGTSYLLTESGDIIVTAIGDRIALE